jgi:hypothetical protein
MLKTLIMRLLYSLLFVFGSLIALQAQPPVPAAPQQEPIVITNVTVHLGNGKAIEQGAIAFEEGKITFLGPTQDWPGYDTHRMIDGQNGACLSGLYRDEYQPGIDRNWSCAGN